MFKPARYCIAAFLVPVFCICSTAQSSIKIKPTADFDQRFDYVNGSAFNIWGYRVGIVVNDKFKAGVGAYYMNQSFNSLHHAGLKVPARLNALSDSFFTSINRKLYFGTLYYEPYLVHRDVYDVSLVFEAGYGRDEINLASVEKIRDKTTSFVPAGAGVSLNLRFPTIGHFSVLNWLGLNAIVGYRGALYKQSANHDYGGAYWSLSPAIFIDRVFTDIYRYKSKKLPQP